jgi:single-strand DNA-binding protein
MAKASTAVRGERAAPEARAAKAAKAAGPPADGPMPSANEVHLIGRVAATVASRTLPSGDIVTVLRLVVARPPAARRSTRTPSADTVDCAIWTAKIRQRAEKLQPGTVVEVDGALRRRFWRTPGGAASRYEVEVYGLRRMAAATAGARGGSG